MTMHEETLFHLALESPAAERATFLERACAGDAALRGRVEALLEAHDHPGSFLRRPALDPAATADTPLAAGEAARPPAEPPALLPAPTGPRSRVGPYKLLQQIGEGGMGAVFLAEQLTPVRRLVALKLIKPGMDSVQVLARFEAERQALPLMDHPNI